MTTKMKEETNGGISFLGLLVIVFIVLKLCKVIEWSWWWVLSPIWGAAVILVTAFVIGFIATFLRSRL